MQACKQHVGLGGSVVKNLPAMQETWVRSQGWEDPLEEGMATHSSILAWRIPMGTLFARFHMGIQNTEVHQRRV